LLTSRNLVHFISKFPGFLLKIFLFLAEQNDNIVASIGMAALRTAVVRPRLKPWIDAFLAVSHNITEEQLADFSANDPFVQALIVNLDGLVNAFRGGLTPANHESFVILVAGEATLQLEKAVMKSSFNRLGKSCMVIGQWVPWPPHGSQSREFCEYPVQLANVCTGTFCLKKIPGS
jgi:hypothetical protein